LVRVAHSLVVGVVPHDARAAQLPRCSKHERENTCFCENTVKSN
jgi:hypothetical protein